MTSKSQMKRIEVQKRDETQELKILVLELCKCMSLVLEHVFNVGNHNSTVAECQIAINKRDESHANYLLKSQQIGLRAYNANEMLQTLANKICPPIIEDTNVKNNGK